MKPRKDTRPCVDCGKPCRARGRVPRCKYHAWKKGVGWPLRKGTKHG
jgi:hypothetical protein